MQDVRGNAVGMVFQDPLTSLNPTMTIGDQIAESVRLHRGAAAAALERAVEVLGLVGMPRPAERVSNFPHQLSGGMRQRVMIAMALACEPQLLIADEPTTALDVTIQKQILELIDGLRQRLGMAVILVTHDLGVIAGHADRVAVMYAGRIVETAERRRCSRTRVTRTRRRCSRRCRSGRRRAPGLYNIPGQPPDLTAPPPGCKFAPRCRYARDNASNPSRIYRPRATRISSAASFRCAEQARLAAACQPRRGGGRRHRLRSPAAASPRCRAGRVPAGRSGGEELHRHRRGVMQRRIGQVSAVADVSFALPRFHVRAGGRVGLR